jgi:Rod binding domain-containing protein
VSDLSRVGVSRVIPLPLTAKAGQVILQAGSAVTVDSKIEKSAKDFESILLGSWLQQAEQSFGTVPGGDGDDGADAGKDQFQGLAMQSLGTSMTAAGGIGIATVISKQLHRAEDAEVAREAKAHPSRTT